MWRMLGKICIYQKDQNTGIEELCHKHRVGDCSDFSTLSLLANPLNEKYNCIFQDCVYDKNNYSDSDTCELGKKHISEVSVTHVIEVLLFLSCIFLREVNVSEFLGMCLAVAVEFTGVLRGLLFFL